MMLPEGAVMQKLACGDVCPTSPTPFIKREICELSHEHNLDANRNRLPDDYLCAKVIEKKEAKQKPKQPRHRQKNRWKLKFHHQALPPEYLDHYEASLHKDKATVPKIILEKTRLLPKPEKSKQESSGHKQPAMQWPTSPNETQVITSNPNARVKLPHRTSPESNRKPTSNIVAYNDLPYMGEMTLNNSKPRRGRKPKKADICHLIYENYGTVVPGRPSEVKPLVNKVEPITSSPSNTTKTDLQNKLITSLLERKISQENKKKRNAEGNTAKNNPKQASLNSDDEPLNLCIRDLDELKLQIQKRFGELYSTAVKKEKTEENIFLSEPKSTTPAISPPVLPSQPCLLWPNPQLYFQQLLFYQRLAAGLPPTPQSDDRSSIASTPSFTLDSPSSPLLDENKSKVSVKQMTDLLDPNLIKSEANRGCPVTPASGPAKRKRSALFIPPVPSKNGMVNASPTAEVSICKFKFTGGSKPKLQEKKMLSVDSGGNFRYYSGGKVNPSEPQDVGASCSNMSRVPPTDVRRHSALATALARPVNFDLDSRKKRKSRKSIQREKLEKKFEKGFLIQTQQLESAEGATYCKFRQLRKFTRYLFRSWKDYLPGNLEQGGPPEGFVPPESSGEEWS